MQGIHDTYADKNVGDLLALFGSSEHLEIAVNQGRACDRLGDDPDNLIGMEVEVEKK